MDGELYTKHWGYAQREARRIYSVYFGCNRWSDLQIDSIASDGLQNALSCFARKEHANDSWLQISIRLNIQKLVAKEKEEHHNTVPLNNIDVEDRPQNSLDYAKELVYNAKMSDPERDVVVLHAISGLGWCEVAFFTKKTERQARWLFGSGIRKMRNRIV